VILWLNGPFGGGKTSTAAALAAVRPQWRVFDPEIIGHFLCAALPDLAEDVDDFQDLPAWRPLVAAALHEVSVQTGQHIVAPQSVLNESYFTEIVRRLASAGQQTFHVVLDAPEAALRRRIEASDEAQAWRLEHLPLYLEARRWMVGHADLVFDTQTDDPAGIARTIVAEVRNRAQVPF
jgi:hypothetical protein